MIISQKLIKMTKENYNKILHDNITKAYKKAQLLLPKKINMEAKNIARSFNVDNKMNITAKCQCFVTVKDHDDFRVNRKYKLLNSTNQQEY